MSGSNMFWLVNGTTVTGTPTFPAQTDLTWEIRGPR
jgi:hypothetical protein